MNYKSLLSLALLLVATGCSSTVSDRPQPGDLQSRDLTQSPASANPSRLPAISQPIVKPTSSAEEPKANSPVASSPPKATQPAPVPIKRQPAEPNAVDPSPVPLKPDSQSPVGKGEIDRDYDLTTPIATTGKMTVRDRIRYIDTDQLITDCPTDTAPYALAESTHYRVQICSEEFDPQLPKYYIGQAKDGSGELRITSTNLDEARQLVFKNDDYTYVLYQDSNRPDQTNAYLEVYTPDGASYAEALFYLYR